MLPTPLWIAPPEAPTLTEHEVHVWMADLDAAASARATLMPELEKIISPEELARANRFLREHDRRRSIAARAILRSLMAIYTGIPASVISFHYHANGKPFLPTESGQDTQQKRSLEFNLSHSGNHALFAFSWDRRIGVDIERIRDTTDLERLARRTLSDGEYAAFRQCPAANKAQLFYRYWTCKEAVIKAAGQTIAEVRRISIPLETDMQGDWIEVRSSVSAGPWALRELEPPPGYTAALAAESQATLSFFDMA